MTRDWRTLSADHGEFPPAVTALRANYAALLGETATKQAHSAAQDLSSELSVILSGGGLRALLGRPDFKPGGPTPVDAEFEDLVDGGGEGVSAPVVPGTPYGSRKRKAKDRGLVL